MLKEKRIRTFVTKDVYDFVMQYAEENFIRAKNGRANFGMALVELLRTLK